MDHQRWTCEGRPDPEAHISRLSEERLRLWAASVSTSQPIPPHNVIAPKRRVHNKLQSQLQVVLPQEGTKLTDETFDPWPYQAQPALQPQKQLELERLPQPQGLRRPSAR